MSVLSVMKKSLLNPRDVFQFHRLFYYLVSFLAIWTSAEHLFYRTPADNCVWVTIGVKNKIYLHSFNSVQCREIAEIRLIDSYLVETGKAIVLSQTLPSRHFTRSIEHILQSSTSRDICNINLNESSNLSYLLCSMQCAWKVNE